MNAKKTASEETAQPDYSIAKKFLDTLLSRSIYCFQTFSDCKDKHIHAGTRIGSLDEHAPWLSQEQAKGAGAFVTIQPLKPGAKRRKADQIGGVAAWFVDLDQEALPLDLVMAHCPYPPSAIVQSSVKGKLHLYWKAQGASLENFREIQRRLIEHFKPFGADPAVKDLPRVMRLPGFLHLKGEPYCVELLHLDGSRVYTDASMLHALSDYAPRAQVIRDKKQSTWQLKAQGDSSDSTEDLPYETRLKASEAYMRVCAGGAGPGNRHAPGINVAINLRANQINANDAQRIMEAYSDLVGWTDYREAANLLKWASQGSFTSRLKPTRQPRLKALDTSRTVRVSPVDLEAAAAQLYELLHDRIENYSPGLDVIQYTTGAGKTRTALEVLANLKHTDWWPTGLRVAFCVDTKEQAAQAQETLRGFKLDAAIYQGRQEGNCPRIETIKGMYRPSEYCNARCNVKEVCRYYAQKRAALEHDFLIIPKPALMNDSDLLDKYQVLIVDESLSDCLTIQQKINSQDLAEIRAALPPDLAPTFSPYLAELGARLTGEDGLIDNPLPTLLIAQVAALGLTDGQLIETEGGTIAQLPRFWSLLATTGAVLRVKGGVLYLTAPQRMLIERLKGKRVINLDATPILDLLAPLEPTVKRIDIPQHYQLWQDRRYRGTRSQLLRNVSHTEARDHMVAQVSEILSYRQGSKAAVFCFKSFKDNFTDLGPGVTVTHYGGDSKGVNTYQDHDVLILVGVDIPNLDSVEDRCHALGVDDWGGVRLAITDAQIAQVVGRVRAVRREHNPPEIFVLSNEPLALEREARDLNDWLTIQKARKPHGSSRCNGSLDFHSIYIKSETNNNRYNVNSHQGFEVFLSEKERVKALVQKVIDRFGFFAHDLLEGARGTGVLISAAAGGPPSPIPLEGVTVKALNRYLSAALSDYQKGSLQVRLGARVPIWGDMRKAEAFITCPQKIAQARAQIESDYKAPGGALRLIEHCKAVGVLSEVDPVQEIREGRNFTRANWAQLLYEYRTG